MTVVVHDTPGLIDLRAFTTFGVNAKPNASNPIGFFGTGLKYAVAVLVREGCGVTVWIGKEPHVFYGVKVDFRGKEFLQLRMRRKRGVTARWHSVELPFTTELGKNWQVWMALRELCSNTLDEGGRTYSADDEEDEVGCLHSVEGVPDRTRIVVSGEAYVDAHAHIDEVFLPGAVRVGTEDVQVLPGPSAYAYFRGLRAHEFSRRAMFTWCFWWPLQLTEDRTVAHVHMLEYLVTWHVMASNDEAFIKSVLRAEDDTWESGLDWATHDHYATPEFMEMARLHGKKSAVVYYDKHCPKEIVAPADWRAEVLEALGGLGNDNLARVVRRHAHLLRPLLRASARLAGVVVPEADASDEVPF